MIAGKSICGLLIVLLCLSSDIHCRAIAAADTDISVSLVYRPKNPNGPNGSIEFHNKNGEKSYEVHVSKDGLGDFNWVHRPRRDIDMQAQFNKDKLPVNVQVHNVVGTFEHVIGKPLERAGREVRRAWRKIFG